MKALNLNIWILLDSRSFGGIETHVAELAHGLLQAQQNVTVVFLQNYGKHPLKDKLKESGIVVKHHSAGAWKLLKKIRQEKPNVIHTHGYKSGILGRLTGLFSQTSIVSSFHAGETPSGRLKLYDWLDRYTAFLAKNAIVVSKKVEEKLPCKSTLVNNFVNLSSYSLSKGQQIAFVGRLSYEKGPDQFIELARYFSQEDFHIYGDGPLINELKANAPKNITFHGQQTSMAEVWPQIGLLLITSRFEGLPMAAIEAMGHGIPIISSDIGGLPSLIEHEINGWLYSEKNIKQAIPLINEYLNMTNDYKRIIQKKSRQKVEQEFSNDVVIPQFIKIYTDAIGDR